jgi:hypothetical protein
MGAQGTTTVDFGSGSLEATTTVSGQSGLLATNLVEAWIMPVNNDDSPWIENMRVWAGNITPDGGSGGSFTILVKPEINKAYGVYTVAWVWN